MPLELPSQIRNITLMGMPVAVIDAEGLLAHVSGACAQGRGGWIVTVNLDILQHFSSGGPAREAYLDADLRIADGMPLLWAAALQGDALPERIAGATFAIQLLRHAATHGIRVALLGGAPGSAERAAERLRAEHPGLPILANSEVQFANPPTPEQVARTVGMLRDHQSRIVLVGLGSPKQEFLIRELRRGLPEAWFIGVGGTFSFVAGDVRRAPPVLQRLGLEWAYRLSQEPRRLAHRYLVRNIPFGARLMLTSAIHRVRSHPGASVPK